MKPPDRQALERAKRASTGQLLLKSARLFDERARARLAGQGRGLTLRPAHTRVLPHLDLDGTRVTELARRLDVTKQAAGQVVGELEAMGVVEVGPDPADGRAKRVKFSARGLRAMQDGLAALGAVEAEVAAVVGRRRMRDLHAILDEIVTALEAAPPRRPSTRQ